MVSEVLAPSSAAMEEAATAQTHAGSELEASDEAIDRAIGSVFDAEPGTEFELAAEQAMAYRGPWRNWTSSRTGKYRCWHQEASKLVAATIDRHSGMALRPQMRA